MAKVPQGVEILPKISIAWVGCTNVTDRRQTDDKRQTDDRQTDGRWHIANVNLSSRSLKITFWPQFFPKPSNFAKILAALSIKFCIKVLTRRTSRVKTPYSKSYAVRSWTLNRQIDHSNQNVCIVSTAKVNVTLILRVPVAGLSTTRRCFDLLFQIVTTRHWDFSSRCVSTHRVSETHSFRRCPKWRSRTSVPANTSTKRVSASDILLGGQRRGFQSAFGSATSPLLTGVWASVPDLAQSANPFNEIKCSVFARRSLTMWRQTRRPYLTLPGWRQSHWRRRRYRWGGASCQVASDRLAEADSLKLIKRCQACRRCSCSSQTVLVAYQHRVFHLRHFLRHRLTCSDRARRCLPCHSCRIW